MVRTPKDVADAELAVLQSLWKFGASTTRQLADMLYPLGTASQSATVLKLFERLAAKSCVERCREGGANVFEAIVHRATTAGGSGKPLRRIKDAIADAPRRSG